MAAATVSGFEDRTRRPTDAAGGRRRLGRESVCARRVAEKLDTGGTKILSSDRRPFRESMELMRVSSSVGKGVEDGADVDGERGGDEAGGGLGSSAVGGAAERAEADLDDGADGGGEHGEAKRARSSASLSPCVTKLEKRKEEKATNSSTSSKRATPSPTSQDGSPARLRSSPGVARESPTKTATVKSVFMFTTPLSSPLFCSSDLKWSALSNRTMQIAGFCTEAAAAPRRLGGSKVAAESGANAGAD
uniref:Uncharacterized protein n=1 Tax=Oryza brachyantha TaxID=4533 RepID=J3NB38_ORYBR